MRILVLGGTRFVGRAYVEEALAAGHELTLFNRGKTAPGLFPEVEKLRGDRDGDLSALEGRTWDVAFDPACYLPRHARASAKLLRDAVEHYTFVSTLSVYADETTPGQDELSPVIELDDPATEDVWANYGALKAAAEQTVQRAFDRRALILRPGYIGGPYDSAERMPWWLRRVARGGEVLVPGEPDFPVQLIDVRDLARFALDLAGRREGGIFNVCAPPQGYRLLELLEICAKLTGSDPTFTHVPEDFLLELGVPDDEPVPWWTSSRLSAMTRFDASRALEGGFSPRPIEESIRDCWEWDRTRGDGPPPRQVGLAPEDEAEILAAWHDR